MDDFETPFGPDSGFPRLALQEVSFSQARPAQIAISPAPPIADNRQRKRDMTVIGDPAGDLAAMVVQGRA